MSDVRKSFVDRILKLSPGEQVGWGFVGQCKSEFKKQNKNNNIKTKQRIIYCDQILQPDNKCQEMKARLERPYIQFHTTYGFILYSSRISQKF